MVIRLIILAALAFMPAAATATGQAPDKLDYEGRTYRVHGFQLSDQMKAKLEQYRKASKCTMVVSANWDGFYAELALRDNRLYLTDLTTDWDNRPGSKCSRPATEEVFGVTLPPEGLFAEWFDGRLAGGVGDCSNFSCLNDNVFHFTKGIVTKIEKRGRDDKRHGGGSSLPVE